MALLRIDQMHGLNTHCGSHTGELFNYEASQSIENFQGKTQS
jgi:hypothetical protein